MASFRWKDILKLLKLKLLKLRDAWTEHQMF
jgi:hypothetical protein